MSYQHTYYDETDCSLPKGKVVCIGRNYVDHIKELNNPMPAEPILFMKPSTAMQALSDEIQIPDYSSNCHHEVEIAILIGSELNNRAEDEVEQGIAGYGIALDLTLRDIQNKLKEQGHPWERAKAFDGSCPLSPFIDKGKFPDVQNIGLELKINGQSRQKGNSGMMITSIFKLISHASKFFTLLPGDIILTGTPAGVSQLQSGDQLELILDDKFSFTTSVK